MPLGELWRRGTDERLQNRKKRDKELDGLADLEYHERLTRFARGSVRHWVNGTTVLDFRPLYAVTVHQLQHQLATCVQVVTRETLDDKQLESLRVLLEQYTTAIRDFEFIHSNRWTTLFVKDIAASRIDNGPGSRLQAALMADLGLGLTGPDIALFSDSDLLGSFDRSLLQHRNDLGRSLGSQREADEAAAERIASVKQAWKRSVFAILGGLAIVIPVLIIVVPSAPLKTVLVVSISILLFAIGFAVFSAMEPESLLTATAAYAAVLMVLLGNSGTTAYEGF